MLQVNTTQVVPFTYRGGVRLRESCWLEGRPYFTRRAIGEFLGYKRPEEQIHRLIQRHPYIDEGSWATQVKLTGVEGGP